MLTSASHSVVIAKRSINPRPLAEIALGKTPPVGWPHDDLARGARRVILQVFGIGRPDGPTASA